VPGAGRLGRRPLGSIRSCKGGAVTGRTNARGRRVPAAAGRAGQGCGAGWAAGQSRARALDLGVLGWGHTRNWQPSDSQTQAYVCLQALLLRAGPGRACRLGPSIIISPSLELIMASGPITPRHTLLIALSLPLSLSHTHTHTRNWQPFHSQTQAPVRMPAGMHACSTRDLYHTRAQAQASLGGCAPLRSICLSNWEALKKLLPIL
jgi:hypothetical protein